ncbi:MAG: archaeal proteasome endopeptidase complex subunit beta [Candidatus Micrarchaeota archaeon]
MTETEKTFLKGTTTVGITFNGGVVLAADKRATMETFIAAKEVDKIHVIGDKIAMTLAGSVGDAQALVRMMRAEIELYKYSKGSDITVSGAATLLANVLQGNKYYPYLVQLIIAGFDEKPRLFDLDPLGGLLPEKYVSTGSGSITAYGLLDENYKEGMAEGEAVRLAAKAVAAAMKRDNATGEGIDVVVITGKGSRRILKNEVANIIA